VRHARRCIRDARVTTGAQRGTSGWPDWAIAYAILSPATLLFAIVNVLSYLDERAAMGRGPIPWWEPAVWEGTSGVVLLALAWIPMWLVRRLPPEGPRWALAIAAQLAMTIPFSLVHVALMIGLRKAIYALAGDHYEFGGGGLLYEYRKDLLSYAIYAATYWLVWRLRMRGAAAAEPAPELFEIDEGQRLIRVARPDILCARSSGNYVEFYLADGRRPLMRTTLASVEAMLAQAGFVRTHKSWLANAAHVVEIVAEGSGDYGLRLTGDLHLPLSRRYPGALALLREGRAN
jgi:LytTr DNA-binding domain